MIENLFIKPSLTLKQAMKALNKICTNLRARHRLVARFDEVKNREVEKDQKDNYIKYKEDKDG